MKAVVQRVTCARVTVGGKEVSSIGRGLCVLLGITRDDTAKESEWMARKILNLRLFDNPENNKPWDKSVKDLGLEVLCVSQFTLCHVLKGNKPDFHNALTSEQSQPMYRDFLKLISSMYRSDAIKDGAFGEMMQVHIQNDGPVTLQFETPNLPPAKVRKPVNPPSQDKTKKSDKTLSSDTPLNSEDISAATAELKVDSGSS